MDTDINLFIAARLRSLRAAQGLSLEALSAASGVSRSALSLIERARSSPTAVVLNRLAAGLGVPLASLLQNEPEAAGSPLARRDQQLLWQDPGSGYLRRSVSPTAVRSPIQLIEVIFPVGAQVAYESGPGGRTVHQQVWLLEGEISLTVGQQTWQLQAGDCLAFTLDQPTRFHNPGQTAARYAVVLVSEPLTSL
jgi:transcriptional regulator with XRE-family HTH domain